MIRLVKVTWTQPDPRKIVAKTKSCKNQIE